MACVPKKDSIQSDQGLRSVLSGLTNTQCFFMDIANTLIRLGIKKTYLYNFDPLKPHFYIVNLGFTGVYIIFHISAQNIDCGYSLEPPRRGGSNEYPQSMIWAERWKISEVFIWNFSFFLEMKFSTDLHRRVFVMARNTDHYVIFVMLWLV